MFLGNQLRSDDPRKEVVYQNFERNLHDIVQVGLDSGAKVLPNTVAVNLKDCTPFASLTNQNLSASDRAQFENLYAFGCQLQNQNDFAGAAQTFEQAAKFDPQFPELQYRWGECSLALTNYTVAREHFQKACDVDALPFRADFRASTTRSKKSDSNLRVTSLLSSMRQRHWKVICRRLFAVKKLFTSMCILISTGTFGWAVPGRNKLGKCYPLKFRAAPVPMVGRHRTFASAGAASRTGIVVRWSRSSWTGCTVRR